MNQKLQNVTRTLRELIKSLPAIEAHCNREAIKRHVQLIVHFQRQYDELIAAMQTARTI